MESKEAVVYKALLIVGVALFLVVVTFGVFISWYRKKSLTAYFEKMRTDFSTIENDKELTAANVHDGLSSYISAIRLLIEEALETVPADASFQQRIDTTFQTTLQSLRNILKSLVPDTLKDKGLQAAVQEQVAMLFSKGSTTVTMVVLVNLSHIKAEAVIHIYRVIQELLNNIRKHAEATEVTISFQKKGRFLFIEVRDNGKGFDNRKTANQPDGFGLTNISNRIHFLQGDRCLQTSPGKGTSYQMLLPVFPD